MTLQEQAEQLIEQWNGFIGDDWKCPEVHGFYIERCLSRTMHGDVEWPYEFIVEAIENHRAALALGQYYQGGRFKLAAFLQRINGGKANYMPPNFALENFDSRTFNKEPDDIADRIERL